MSAGIFAGWPLIAGQALSTTSITPIIPVTPELPLTALRVTNAGFAPVFEQSPQNGISQTSRAITAPFNEPFKDFEIVYQLFRTRQTSVTGTVTDGSGNVGDILTVTAVSAGAVVPGIPLTVNTAITVTGTYVVSQLTGALGGIGTYKLSAVQAGVTTSVTIASTLFTDELYQNAGAQLTWESGFLDTVTQSMTNIPPRTRATFSNANTFVYDYSTWDKTKGYFKSDKMSRPAASAEPMEIWSRAIAPASGFAMPANKPACSVFANRWWGNEVSTAATTVDPITGTTIARVESTDAGLSTLCIAPVALIIYTAGNAKSVMVLGDSRASFTGLAGKQAGVIVEPAGFGDSQGDIYGRGSPMERGIHNVAKQHSFMLGKPTDQALTMARSPGAWRFRRQLIGELGTNDSNKIVENAMGQNDNNNGSVVFSNNMALYVGQVIHADTGTGNMYICTVAGTATTVKPTSTAANTDITVGTATVRYIGTQAGTDTASNGIRQGIALVERLKIINASLRSTAPGCSIVQEGLAPYSSSTDGWLTAANQTDGFNMLGGKYLQGQLNTVGASITGADRFVSMMPVLAGSRTVNGGADDGSRTWKTDGTTTYLYSPDGIHTHNKGADVGATVYTKAALTGAA
jgi:hypothetical protein